MTPGTVHRSSFRHELVLHSSMEEMLDFIVPFAQEGVAAGEPTLLLVRPETAAAVLRTVGHSPHLTILPALGQPGRGAADLRATDALLAGRTAPASRVRILNQEPTVPEMHWHEWRRLEAAVNLALSRYEAWAVCVYDRRALSDEMVDDLHATHHAVGHAGEHRHNDRYQDPVALRPAPFGWSGGSSPRNGGSTGVAADDLDPRDPRSGTLDDPGNPQRRV